MKKITAKNEAAQSDSSQTEAQKRIRMLGAAFVALGSAVGLDVDNAFAGPRTNENKITVNTDAVVNKAKTADKAYQQMDAYIKQRQLQQPDTIQSKNHVDQQKLEMQQNLDNIPNVADAIKRSTPSEVK